MKKILVAVTGMSPQIVTETLFVLAVRQEWIPDEIHVLTTRLGAVRLQNTLLGESGHFVRFCQEYGMPHIAFSAAHIHIIEDDQGRELDDIRTPAQNNLAADMIVRFIHQLCAREDSVLHVSIAGGRKSMGFYIGYALSLFGRRRDRLSHVLVNEPFENHPDFFYPPRESRILATAAGQIDARTAEVMLADIPFVRMRDGLPHLLPDSGWTYSQAVEQTQRHMSDWHMEIDVAAHALHCAAHTIPLTPQQFALYAAMVSLKTEGREISRHVQDDMAELLARYLRFYPALSGEEKHKQQQRLAGNDYAEMSRILQEASSQIYRKLRKALGEPRAQQFRIISSGRNNSRRYSLNADKSQWRWTENLR